jgi:uncharacterized cupredoxin-like copper-binding protein
MVTAFVAASTAAPLVPALSAVAAPAVAASKAAGEPDSAQIGIKLSTTGEQVSFDQLKIVAKAKKKFRLSYRNDAPVGSQITHNVAIIPAKRVKAILTILQENSYELAKIKDSPDVLGMTRTLEPGDTDTIELTIDQPGEFVYICLMPGHGDMMGMRGRLVVKR